MAALEGLQAVFPAFLDFNEEFKGFTIAFLDFNEEFKGFTIAKFEDEFSDQIGHIVGKGIRGKLEFVKLKIANVTIDIVPQGL